MTEIGPKESELNYYGKVLAGEERDLEKAGLARGFYLKGKLRRLLDVAGLGDDKDISTDLAKSIALGIGIQAGLVTDQKIIERYLSLVKAQLDLYGGPEAIVAELDAQAERLSGLLAKYYEAKAAMAGAKDEEAVRLVDIE